MSAMAAVTIPILPSSDFDATARFYGRIGFAERGRWPGEYLILHRPDGIEVHFWMNAGVDAATNQSACYVRFPSADEARALHTEWAALDLPGGRLHSPTETEYGHLEFALIDPHGNLVRIGGPLRSADRERE